ncbi:MAG: sulfite exporter TauE/SafE family protein [Gammaproteobacteria bacterium]|nr:sulfite exporter TauE/SafE family protein [Gammaproteobacteria bacterium]MBU1508583.1 sulfite exporter TauE/SafE family protein [Gammaproteobacteria bacterium]MBU2119656.1 sulfite exporter TauE/SafE family protein [Gammaproteobacteria bacterium]MBU2169086.1 sulfite exporter TauE/SafE family protein [Gammaproteobacteria bacterium]MBU2202251.1 sulfite exporter TauE/SafE family protein [Gammaproteobacteria bacterium]
MHELAFVFAGFAVGLIVGLTGVGGGSLMTPVLIFFFGVKPHLAIGTDLLFAAFTKMGGTVSMARQRLVPWRVVGQLCAGSIPAALLSLWALKTLGPASGEAQRIMTTTLGFALLLTAAATLYKVVAFSKQRQAADQAKRKNASELATRPRHWSLPVLLGAVIGTLVTFTSVGAGAIGVTVLLLVYPLLPLPRVIGADIAYAVPLTLVAGLGHASLGSVDWPLLAQLLAGSLPGIWIGSRLVTRTPERLIRSALSVLLAWAGFKLILI